MSHRIDQLFKNKLGEQDLPPTLEAWEKVHAGLSKKNKGVIYWRAAASFMLFGLLISSWYFFNRPGEITSSQLAESEKTNTTALANETELNKVETDSKSIVKADDSKPGMKISVIDKTSTVKKKITIQADAAESPTEQPLQNEVIELPQSMTVAEVEVTQEKPIKIEFSLPTLERTNPQTEVAAITETERSTGILKFLETARDVKNGDAEFSSSLRNIKNELFAFDFKKDKPRRN